MAALRLLLLRNLACHRCGAGAFSSRILEDVSLEEMNVLDKGARLFKLLLTLLRETDNHIGRQRRISIYLTQQIAFVFVFFCGIFPVHPL